MVVTNTLVNRTQPATSLPLKFFIRTINNSLIFIPCSNIYLLPSLIIKKINRMEQNKVDIYIATNSKFFESHLIPHINQMLQDADDSKFIAIQSVSFKDPTTAILISIFAGQLGIDRFFIGDTGMGVGKLLTCGGLGIWAIVDWFLIMGRARELNYQRLQQVLLY